MPSSKALQFREVSKNCLVCQKPLNLNNVRDISRKNYCSRSCANSYGSRKRIDNLPMKTCEMCGNDYKSKSNNQRFCSIECHRKEQVPRSYRYLNGNWYGYILLLIKKEGRKHLQIDDMMNLLETQKGKCAISGIPLTCIKIPKSPKVHTNLSIDRIDSSRGYDRDNLQFVCAIVNVMKSNLTMGEFEWWIAQIHGGLQNSKF